MIFNKENYTVETVTLGEESLRFRAFRNRIYVDKPINSEFQQMHIFAPEAYYEGESVQGYTLEAAPIFMPNTVGGYMPGGLEEPGLHDGTGKKLTLDGNGNGSFKEHMESIVLASAQKALEQGIDLSDKEWLTIENGRAVAMDFHGYAEDITRMKNPPAFDKLSMDSIENDLFGSATENFRHFTKYSREHSLAAGLMAEDSVIKMMNPMNYIEDEAAQTAFHWRIRHGECDRDTSLAISAMFVLKLRSGGHSVDYHAPWNVPHAGDYDLEELFAWIDGICKEV